jgi:hypothetical protein
MYSELSTIALNSPGNELTRKFSVPCLPRCNKTLRPFPYGMYESR